jgi:hypothetical protein
MISDSKPVRNYSLSPVSQGGSVICPATGLKNFLFEAKVLIDRAEIGQHFTKTEKAQRMLLSDLQAALSGELSDEERASVAAALTALKNIRGWNVLVGALCLKPALVEQLAAHNLIGGDDFCDLLGREETAGLHGVALGAALKLHDAAPDLLMGCLKGLSSSGRINERHLYEGKYLCIAEIAVRVDASLDALECLKTCDVDLLNLNEGNQTFLQAYDERAFGDFVNTIKQYQKLFKVEPRLLNNVSKSGKVLLDQCHCFSIVRGRWMLQAEMVDAAQKIIRLGADPLLSRLLPLSLTKSAVDRLPVGDDRLVAYLQRLQSTDLRYHFVSKHLSSPEGTYDRLLEACKSSNSVTWDGHWTTPHQLYYALEEAQTSFIYANTPMLQQDNQYVVLLQANRCIGYSTSTSELLDSKIALTNDGPKVSCTFYEGNTAKLYFLKGQNGVPHALPVTAYAMPSWASRKVELTLDRALR